MIVRTGGLLCGAHKAAAAWFPSQQGVRGREGVLTVGQVNGGLSTSECQAVIDCCATAPWPQRELTKQLRPRRRRTAHIHPRKLFRPLNTPNSAELILRVDANGVLAD